MKADLRASVEYNHDSPANQALYTALADHGEFTEYDVREGGARSAGPASQTVRYVEGRTPGGQHARFITTGHYGRGTYRRII